MIAGKDYIGLGVGALLFNNKGQVFLAQRGNGAKNEIGSWEFPGGEVKWGEALADAIKREFLEEYGVVIKIEELLGAFDHILPEEKQHWVAVTYVASHVSGVPSILEPKKCSDIGWFTINQLPSPLSVISKDNLKAYRLRIQK